MKNIFKKMIKKYEDRLVVLGDNKSHDTTSGYPYEHEIKCTTEFVKDLKKIQKNLAVEKIEKHLAVD